MSHRFQHLADLYCNKECFLDGRPARIIGRLLPFAIIRSNTEVRVWEAEFSWNTVDTIMRKDKHFKS